MILTRLCTVRCCTGTFWNFTEFHLNRRVLRRKSCSLCTELWNLPVLGSSILLVVPSVFISHKNWTTWFNLAETLLNLSWIKQQYYWRLSLTTYGSVIAGATDIQEDIPAWVPTKPSFGNLGTKALKLLCWNCLIYSFHQLGRNGKLWHSYHDQLHTQGDKTIEIILHRALVRMWSVLHRHGQASGA